MKKIIALLLAVLLCAALVACGGSDDSKEKSDDAPSINIGNLINDADDDDDVDVDDNDDDDDDDDDDVPAATLAPVSSTISLSDFLDSSEGKTAVSTLVNTIEQSASGYATASCYAQGKCLIIDCSFTIDIPAESMSQVKSALETAMSESSFSSAMSSLLSGLQTENVDCDSIKLRYLTADGVVLAEKTSR